ncbi:mammalian cell entry protein [Mycolicibacterium goodii]|uniref:Mammalian cell entry protein n=1 Tax=Mycolicibacterium goodii TaxID=134601 RepID=A0ABS6HQW0_MYCGD|nr:mammalian cell entry protein [Mycolicibacterium goodii]MBU8810871.1 mammalian cell entry protein [Mycolicibacterium goodii]MBU8823687.1 mammalian cell entry protein [Mycolicibacterium goodii]MBU8835858.1 mammalian cell entry protein [Mycolicibacterium goodii]
MTDRTALESSRPVRRRASRPAGPVSSAVLDTTAPVAESRVEPAAPAPKVKPVKVPPRRRPHSRLVAIFAAAVLGVATAVLGGLTYVLVDQQRSYVAAQERDQRFVDTAKQTVVNMFSYTQDTIDESVNRFVDGTSGPLRDMMSQGNNAENLKALFRDTNASSEAVVNAAALEKVDEVAKNASVLVSVWVTVTDLDGINAPTRPYRLRVIVHEDDNGHMTGYDLKYPDGGN